MTGIIRAARPAKGWTEIPDSTLRDRRLSYRARGVLARLLSNADGFRMTAEDLARESPDGRHSVLSALKELREAGYLVTLRVQGEKGRFRTETYVFDFPQDTASLKVQKTEVRLPDVGPPNVGPPDVGCTNSFKEYQQEDQQENQQQHQAAAHHTRACAREAAPASGGGAAAAATTSSTSTPTPTPAYGGQQGKARRRRASGIVTWDATDIQEAGRIEAQHPHEDIHEAVESLEKQGLEPVPGRVLVELERLAKAREAARRAEERRAAAMATQPADDPRAREIGERMLSKIRALRKEKELYHEVSL